MGKLLLLFSILSITLFANEISSAKLKKLAFKGSKIASVFCNKDKLPQNTTTFKEALSKLKSSNACANLNSKKLELVAHYLNAKSAHKHSKIDVPNGAKCPVCGMFVYKYPKWVALIEVDGKKNYFDGVKDMLKYLLFDGDFKYNRDKITKIEVTNYYTLDSINAKDAFYVYDSKQYGPMGREFIPFSTKKEATSFINDHGGELMLFKDITPKLVLRLDGVELSD
jgi:nitrous oxide reductase accessory protein NosL